MMEKAEYVARSRGRHKGYVADTEKQTRAGSWFGITVHAIESSKYGTEDMRKLQEFAPGQKRYT
jgi:hypothetical protein